MATSPEITASERRLRVLQSDSRAQNQQITTSLLNHPYINLKTTKQSTKWDGLFQTDRDDLDVIKLKELHIFRVFA